MLHAKLQVASNLIDKHCVELLATDASAYFLYF